MAASAGWVEIREEGHLLACFDPARDVVRIAYRQKLVEISLTEYRNGLAEKPGLDRKPLVAVE